ncbi:hypothetical protein [Thermovibrio sp.]
MSREKRKFRVKIDGKPVELEVSGNLPTSSLLKLIEYKLLFPERSIKHVEFKGEKVHPVKVDEMRLEELNIITEPSANMVSKQIEFAALALDGVIRAIDQIYNDWYTRPELAKLMLNDILDSLDLSVKVVDTGSRILPIYDGIQEEIAKLEDAVFELDDLLYEGKEEEALKVLLEKLKPTVIKWRDFLKSLVKFVKSAPKETH